MSASPDSRHSDIILFLRYDLIRRKPENERSASEELTRRVQPITSKTRMLGYISSSVYFTQWIRFPGSCKAGVYCFQKYCHSLNSERREDGVGKSCCQNCSFSARLRRLLCFITVHGTKEKQFGPSLVVFGEKVRTTTCFSICKLRSPLAPEILLCEYRRTDREKD